MKQYQRNNQPQSELSTTYLDESQKIDLILSVLWFGPFGFAAMTASLFACCHTVTPMLLALGFLIFSQIDGGYGYWNRLQQLESAAAIGIRIRIGSGN
jgi:hypothetical protein